MKILEWIATGFTILGAILSAMNLFPYNIIAFNTGSVLWFIWASKKKVPSIATVNGVMILIYIMGLIK